MIVVCAKIKTFFLFCTGGNWLVLVDMQWRLQLSIFDEIAVVYCFNIVEDECIQQSEITLKSYSNNYNSSHSPKVKLL